MGSGYWYLTVIWFNPLVNKWMEAPSFFSIKKTLADAGGVKISLLQGLLYVFLHSTLFI